MNNNIETQYLALLRDVLENGHKKNDRTSTGTISKFGAFLEHDMSLGFPALTTKKLAWKQVVTELAWFISGNTNISWLIENDCNIWNGDAFKHYLRQTRDFKGDWPTTQEAFIDKVKTDKRFAKRWANLGPIYGKKWTNFRGKNQVHTILNLLKNDPDSRRMLVSAWDPSDVEDAALPPCHYAWQVWTRKLSLDERLDYCKKNGITLEHSEAGLENVFDDMRACGVPERAISLHFNMRSNDLFLGAPFNIASYALLLLILGSAVKMVPEKLSCAIGDAHIYSNHVDQVEEQLIRAQRPLPNFEMYVTGKEFLEYPKLCTSGNSFRNFELTNYNPWPTIKAPLSN